MDGRISLRLSHCITQSAFAAGILRQTDDDLSPDDDISSRQQASPRLSVRVRFGRYPRLSN
jgi:hypothetical protein